MGRTISGWGNFPTIEADVSGFSSEGELRRILEGKGLIAQGLARSYGDSALSERVVLTSRFDRFLSFDENSGILSCESGVPLEAILDVFVRRGWFLPVTPGTKFVTLGGAIASDVHGKNHHVSGSFCQHVQNMEVMLPTGEVAACSPTQNTELFRATCGGMGLTGVILRASLRLIPIETAYIGQQTVKAKGLSHIMDLFEESAEWTYSVAWIDCLSTGRSLGRSILMRGEHARRDDLPKKYKAPLMLKERKKLSVPFNMPGLALNSLSVRAFNALYYGKVPSGAGRSMVSYDSFFYPLDAIHHWNRIYGKGGFAQYQFVLPMAASGKGMREMLTRIARSGMGSFLAVLKLFGKQEEGLLNFPMEGYTLALDFPMKRGLMELLDELDRMVLDFGGRLYLTKDSRMGKDTLHASYPRIGEFMQLRERFDPRGAFSSLQSRRLGL